MAAFDLVLYTFTIYESTTGSIPPKLEDLGALLVLNLSFNQLHTS